MSNELQAEELEVLKSIYDGDPNFKDLGKTTPTFQYKIGDEDGKSFLLEISWGELYPDAKPQLNLDSFYNKHLTQNVKQSVISRLIGEAEQYLGTAMTYTLIEWAKENISELLAEHEKIEIEEPEDKDKEDEDNNQNLTTADAAPKTRKVQLSKQQKRKLFDQLNNKGERPRGWDWVDVIKHLSQSGSKEASPSGES